MKETATHDLPARECWLDEHAPPPSPPPWPVRVNLRRSRGLARRPVGTIDGMRSGRQTLGTILVALVMTGLGSPGSPPVGALPRLPTPPGSTTSTERPYGLTVPERYEAGTPAALVILLHGYSADGAQQDAYFGLSRLAEDEGFLVAFPDGTRDPSGNRFWNATDACCDFYRSEVDDVAYLDSVIDEIAGRYSIDPSRIYLVGHSNGAFMSHRLACDRAGRIAAIVTLAGMQWDDAARCPAGSPVSVLHVHGDRDETIRYEGGSTPTGDYPGAVATAGAWAVKDACGGALARTAERRDLEGRIAGAETAVDRYSGCPGVDIELWTIEGGAHVPALNRSWAEAIWTFLAAHPKAA